MPDRARRQAVLWLLLLSLVWSYNWVVMKQVLRYSGPFEFAAWRYALGTLVLFAALRWRRVSLRPPPWAPVLAIGLAQTFAFQALVQLALVGGGAGKTALLAYTMPFWAVLLAWLVLRERPSRVQWISLVIALVGLALVIDPWHGVGALGSALLAIAGGLAWAIGMVLSKRVFLRGGVSALSLTAWQMLAGSVGLVLLAAFADERPIAWTPPFLFALAYNAVLASGLAWLLWSWVVDRLPTSVAGLSSLVVPILGVLFAWGLLGEVPSPPEGVGMGLLAIALLVVARARRATG
ncbi:DMT family transporter [Cognatiluteimonas telluris]|jgi:drug/metabolite transporter (DMT)-like permease|uniref:DMT family transporter n=1 Tax=Cognatiluteimonas telluris TaxID=1104775 RepID=UPI00140AAB1C|nr:EamA family transporter [Lysobacter telluris]